MTNQSFRSNDHVRVTFTGTVTDPQLAGNKIWVTEDSSGSEHAIGTSGTYEISLLESAYEGGAVYMDADNVIWYRDTTDPSDCFPWRDISIGRWESYDKPRRPLRKLVPEEGS